MLATIICVVVFIAMIFFICLLWEIGDLLKVNADLREIQTEILDKNKELEDLVEFYKKDNQKVYDLNTSLSAQLMRLANQSSRRGNIDNNEGD